ncbi:1-acyl-sn-glycerol-3-phosphate acyltransferase [Abyssibius alkaniclasticus]|uniref:lysophospholipid acyltransferase family protein n=1 Tax=Abyssibius alkaniclasticus TaxID=2881234 RepID=UPI002364679B|nr:lysophospholipid acyltransferase family protein [Abyssibius alkaniclasticus]UPH71350.1 1-acyl-sn-glycerol-3-phosphate acyltransferase [Abyssibius alkaniclasticus]
MLFLRSQLADLIMYVLMAIMGILFAPAAIYSRGGAYWAIKVYCRTVFWVLRILCGLKVEFRGEVPQGEVIVASKHMSFLDVMMHAYALPRVKFVMKRQLRYAPILGLYGMRIGSAPVARGKKGSAVRKLVRDVESDKENAGQLVIYPQGTRVLPGSDKPYKVGAGVLYTRMGQDCVPAATNTGVFWARRSPYRYPGTAVVEYLPMIERGLKLDEFMKRLEDVVETRSNALMREAGYAPPDPR